MSLDLKSTTDCAIADPSSAEPGRIAIRTAEFDAPGLMALRAEFESSTPLSGKKIVGSQPLTAATAVLVETLTALGAEVRWAAGDRVSTQDQVAAALVAGPTGTPAAPAGVAVFGWQGQTPLEHWSCLDRVLTWPDGSGPDSIVDDGGDLTRLIHLGVRFESAGAVPPATTAHSGEYAVILGLLHDRQRTDAGRYFRLDESIVGVSEGTFAGVRRLAELDAAGELLFPAVDVTDRRSTGRFDMRVRPRSLALANHAIAQLELHRTRPGQPHLSALGRGANGGLRPAAERGIA